MTAMSAALAFTGFVRPNSRVARPFRHASSTTRTFMAMDTQQVEKAQVETTTMMESSALEIPQQQQDNMIAMVEEEKELSKTQKLMAQVKDAGTAGVLSYALWELAFWFLSVPVCVYGYKSVTGHWPDLSNAEDQAQLGAEAFAFVNFARFAVPLRIGLALSTTPWIQENLIDKFTKNKKDDNNNDYDSTMEDPSVTMDYQKKLLSDLKKD